MKVAYNSAYIQIETFNFTFAQQAVIVLFLSLFQLPRNPLPEKNLPFS